MAFLSTYRILGLDLLFAMTSFWLAFLVRYEFAIPQAEWPIIFLGLPFVVGLQCLAYFLLKIHRLVLRRITFEDSVRLLASIVVGGMLIGMVLHFSFEGRYPRSVFLIYPMFLASQVLALRYLGRLLHERKKRLRRKKRKNEPLQEASHKVLIIGAGDLGVQLVRTLRKRRMVTVIGFVDDDPRLQHREVCSVPILGTCDAFAERETHPDIDEIIIAIAKASGPQIKRMVSLFRQFGVPIKRLPNISEIVNAKNPLQQLRDIQLEDLLRREPVVTDMQRIAAMVEGKTVFITGAAGSIGSEIALQTARLNPNSLHLIDMAESALYETWRNITEALPEIKIAHHLVDIKNQPDVEELFKANKPDVVFHAAAYKHVPMLERHPHAAVLNNVLGGKNVADLSVKHEVARFVLISTDKAVAPSSLMGATKRLLEFYTGYLNQQSKCRFTAVRFGNVLGSNGSILRIFERQLKNGGPLTVTHPETTRFFMTIPEATQLVLQASAMGNGGEIFVLDMGEPVKIVDLAKDFIELSGSSLLGPVDIVFTGLRPGEKLHETLFTRDEDVQQTTHTKIMVTEDKLTRFNPKALDFLIARAESRDSGLVSQVFGLIECKEPTRKSSTQREANHQLVPREI